MLSPKGEIDVFLRAVGHTPAEGNPASVEVLKVLATTFERDVVDTGDGRKSTYWSFYSAGTEFVWRQQTLLSISLFTQGDESAGYDPYPRRLFDAFGNDAGRREIEQIFGAPEETGVWEKEWILYRDQNGTELHFEFDENDRLWSVGVTMKGWQDF
ncbi:hypothetical protein HMPREF1531_00619 [Propionibacterium sp. oral taxon 192 str. F0372]|nr:hypothetical protein HMPREF1531_00619 [Propionibacterium sp. oral taxon 192 str. F0372]